MLAPGYTLEAVDKLGVPAPAAPLEPSTLEMPRSDIDELEAKRAVLVELQAVEAALAEAQARRAAALAAFQAAEAEALRLEEEAQAALSEEESKQLNALRRAEQAQREAVERAVRDRLQAPPPYGWQGALGDEIADGETLQELDAVLQALEAQQAKAEALRQQAMQLLQNSERGS